MRMDDFAGLVDTRADNQKERPDASDLLNAAKKAITWRSEGSRRAEEAARNMTLRERVEGFAPSVDEVDPMQALMMSLAGLRIGAAPVAAGPMRLGAASAPMQIGPGSSPMGISAPRIPAGLGAARQPMQIGAARPMLQLGPGPELGPLTPISAPRIVNPAQGSQPAYNSPIEDWMWRYATK